jgi:hypothetical protein
MDFEGGLAENGSAEDLTSAIGWNYPMKAQCARFLPGSHDLTSEGEKQKKAERKL